MISQRFDKFESSRRRSSEFYSLGRFQYQSFPTSSLTRWLFKFYLSCCFTSFAFFFNSKTLLFIQKVKWGLFSTPIRLTWLFRVQQILVSKSILTSNFRQIYVSFETECFPFDFNYNVSWIPSLDEIVNFSMPVNFIKVFLFAVKGDCWIELHCKSFLYLKCDYTVD